VKNVCDPAVSVRTKYSSIPRPVSKFVSADALCSCTGFDPSCTKLVVVPPTVLDWRLPVPSYTKFALSGPAIASNWSRAFHEYVFVPSLVRFPFRSYVSVVPPNVI
jgi:hypothetical protein